LVDIALDTLVQEPVTLVDAFEYYPPFEVVGVAPDWGMAVGGETVVIEGADFIVGIDYEVSLGEVACSGVVVGDGSESAGTRVTTLECVTGAYDTGGASEAVVDLTVSDGVMEVTVVDAYEYIEEFYLELNVDSEKLSFNLLPSKTGVVSSLPQLITVTTNSRAGYRLLMSGKTSERALVGSDTGAKIAASAGTLAEPLVLARNTWGFAWARVGVGTAGLSVSDFDATYNVEVNNLNSVSRWAGAPMVGEELTVRVANGQRKAGEQTTIFYAVNSDLVQPVDTYRNTILYTAIEN
jgi:hypothetical protein